MTWKLLTSWKFSESLGWAMDVLEKDNTSAHRVSALPSFLTLDSFQLSSLAVHGATLCSKQCGLHLKTWEALGLCYGIALLLKVWQMVPDWNVPIRAPGINLSPAGAAGNVPITAVKYCSHSTLKQLMEQEKFVALILDYQIWQICSSHSENLMI